MEKVNLFIVGTAKGGTTSLHTYLDGHPDVCMSNQKEPNYFTWMDIRSQELYYIHENHIQSEEEYLSLFDSKSNKKVLGEASVSYLFYPGTAQKIKNYNPDARIIILLRDPVKRAHSHYLMDKRLGMVKEDLISIFQDPEEGNKLFYQQYIKLGLYYKQVKEYLEAFDNERVRIILSSDFQNDTKKVLNDIVSFLELDSSIDLDISSKHNVSGKGKNAIIRFLYKQRWLRKMLKAILPKGLGIAAKNASFEKSRENLSPDFEQELRTYYKEDILKLEGLIHQNLSAWYE